MGWVRLEEKTIGSSEYPEQFIETVGRIFREEGRQWLQQLPGILERCRQKWGLEKGTLCPNLSINYIEFTRNQDGLAVALKVGVPNDELFSEMDALRLYNGQGAVPLLDADRELSAFVMKRVQPGDLLWEIGDNLVETRIAARLMLQLQRPLPKEHGFPTFFRWLNRAFTLTRSGWDPGELMPRKLIDHAEAAFAEIDRQKEGDVLLHGDLHHENILLDAASGWTVIDPKGVAGGRALEVGRYIQNQLPDTGWEDFVLERIEIFSEELDLPRRQVLNGALVDCVLSHCWGFEDETLWDGWQRGVEMGWWLVEELVKSEPGW